MLRPPVCDRETWSRTATFLLLGFVCYLSPWTAFAALPLPTGDAPALRIQGSNTIGASLGPALVKGLMQQQGLSNIRTATSRENEQVVSALNAAGRTVSVEIAAHGSGTGFSAIGQGNAELAASSRPIKDSEVATLSSLGNMKSRDAEQVIAIDGLAIVLHPDNPVSTLSTEQLAQIFSGEVSDWAQLGGRPGSIDLYARDDNSGTFDTFKELVLTANGKQLSAKAKRFESSEQLSDSVAADANGIGFIGLPYVRKAKAVAIAAGESQPMLPSVTLIATEDYPLSRRLFLYGPPKNTNPWAEALLQFAQSPQGQEIVAQNGFIAQTVQAVSIEATADMPATYQTLTREAKRLSVNFRFQEGSASLDNKAQQDLRRVLDYLRQHDKLQRKVVLVGFGDPKAVSARAELLSKLRAMAVRRELVREGVVLREVAGLGDELPVADNEGDSGRFKNRRVEVWVY
ncbi:phosphate transport system substrate-binding protein [Pseudomonas sp. BIGb0408]|uniref:Phosphate transport system substrate-binding protein n=1 Tax=Phytopseudomonas flavescens TaxID=29435 RepID=A0A7Y9XM76_9GAMM|nr:MULTISPECIES: phosphate ABC transporter substrate-binding/OmpA family protein [Pseudomonas]MCW2292866.1 phosphate transport system substrate-binding protein [Pseudomonas sp. BIGb0408]NYH72564.1 phosphate transport system substrate-binding protein [Pseudomonas flavescens]